VFASAFYNRLSHIDKAQMRLQFVRVIVQVYELWPCVCLRVLRQIEPY